MSIKAIVLVLLLATGYASASHCNRSLLSLSLKAECEAYCSSNENCSVDCVASCILALKAQTSCTSLTVNACISALLKLCSSDDDSDGSNSCGPSCRKQKACNLSCKCCSSGQCPCSQ